jgi:O-antigen/teichoic acid export membrane protein
VFFAWQLVATVLHAVALRRALWKALAAGERPRFRWELLRKTRRFTTATSAIAVLSLILTQTDKVVLSHVVSLSAFGYYTLAWIAASTTYRITGPVAQAVSPRLTQLATTNDRAQLVRTFHHAAQLMTVLILPPCLLLAFFPREIVGLWTRDPRAVDATHVVLTILAVGSALNAMLFIPSGLQIAHGRTRLAFAGRIVAVGLQVPLVIILTLRFGVVGAATAWLALNASYVLLGGLMVRELLPDERWRWFGADVLLPGCAAVLPVLAVRLLIGNGLSAAVLFSSLAVAGVLSVTAAVVAAPHLRRLIRSYVAPRLAPAWKL